MARIVSLVRFQAKAKWERSHGILRESIHGFTSVWHPRWIMPDDQREAEEPDGSERPRAGLTPRLFALGGVLLLLGLMQFGSSHFEYSKLLTKYPADSNAMELDPGYVSFYFRRIGLGLIVMSGVVFFIGLLSKQSQSYSRHSNNRSHNPPSEASSNFDFLAGNATLEEEDP